MSKPEHVDANLRALDITTDPGLIADVERCGGAALGLTWQSGLLQNQD
jgi:hypothetical protein